jgi:hypothetical protein
MSVLVSMIPVLLLSTILATSFHATGNLTVPRAAHRATLLHDGRVLLTGGVSVTDRSAETYNPATGTFNRVGDMLLEQLQHEDTLLADGRVLASGGGFLDDGRGAPFGFWGRTGCEIFDPATNRWRVTGPLLGARLAHQATRLADGRVLITGGEVSLYGGFHVIRTVLDTVEIWDPATESSSPAGTMREARSGHTATLLSDGRVLLAGGAIGGAEVFDPATGVSTATGSMTSPRLAGHTATLLADGTVLVAGGKFIDNSTTLSEAEVYDPATNGWTPVGGLAAPRIGHAATRLADGRVLVSGGASNATTEIYDPQERRFVSGEPMSISREGHTATLLDNGDVLLAGGLTEPLAIRPSTSAEVWSATPRTARRRAVH